MSIIGQRLNELLAQMTHADGLVVVRRASSELKRLEKENDDLLEACKLCEAALVEHELYDDTSEDPSREHEAAKKAARAAIAKAGERKV